MGWEKVTLIGWKRWNGDSAQRQVSEKPWDWVGLGVAPVPRGTLRVFLYHLGHGLVMGYPILDVVVFAWRHRNGFDKKWREKTKEQYLEDGIGGGCGG